MPQTVTLHLNHHTCPAAPGASLFECAETMGVSVQGAARIATLETMTGSIRRLLAGGAARLDSGVESRLGWLASPPSIPLFVAGSG